MELASDRLYRFCVGPEAFWSAIGSTDDYRRWWPWLRTFDARGLVGGDVWRCAVRPPLRYTVRFDIRLGDVEPPTLIRAEIDGDITGTAQLLVTPSADGCDVHLTSRLAPNHRALGLLAFLAQPLVRRGHDWVLDTGARQFADRALNGGAHADQHHDRSGGRLLDGSGEPPGAVAGHAGRRPDAPQ